MCFRIRVSRMLEYALISTGIITWTVMICWALYQIINWD